MNRREIEVLVERDRIAADLARLEARTAGAATPEGAAEVDAIRARADSALQLWNETATDPVPGERPSEYGRRMLAQVQRHSPQWRHKDFSNTHRDALEVAEGLVYADARAAAYDPATVPAGQLRPVRERDAAGRLVTRWVGREPIWMDFFMSSGRIGTVNRNAE